MLSILHFLPGRKRSRGFGIAMNAFPTSLPLFDFFFFRGGLVLIILSALNMFNSKLDITPFFSTFNVISKIETFNSPASSVSSIMVILTFLHAVLMYNLNSM